MPTEFWSGDLLEIATWKMRKEMKEYYIIRILQVLKMGDT